MKQAARTFFVALLAHLVAWGIALVTALATQAELRARGATPDDAEALLEILLHDGLSSPPLTVVMAGALALACLSPFFEAVLAACATGARVSVAFRVGLRLTPASFAFPLTAGIAAGALLALTLLVPFGVLEASGELLDERSILLSLSLASIPSVLVLLALGLACDVGRLRLVRGERFGAALVAGFKASASWLFPAYTATLALGLVASIGHAWLGTTSDASSLFAGGVVLLVRPLSRAAFMLVAARHERSR